MPVFWWMEINSFWWLVTTVINKFFHPASTLAVRCGFVDTTLPPALRVQLTVPVHYINVPISKWRKEMFYLTMHSTHFILRLYGIRHMVKDHSDSERKEGNVLFNDALNTFYLRLYVVRHMVKDHSDSEKGNPLPPHRLLFTINSNGSFICTIPQTG